MKKGDLNVRARSSVVIIENDQVLLIERNWGGVIYYVFPGGGIEEGEDRESAAKREALEELGVEVYVNECIAEVTYKGSSQYFYLSEIISGKIGTGQGEEYTDETRGRGTYKPMWVDLKKLSSIDVRPMEVATKIQSLFT